MTTPTPDELRSAYNSEIRHMLTFGEIFPGVNGDASAAIRAAIHVIVPDEPILARGTDSEIARQDERYRIRAKFFALVDAIQADQ
jgi:hypothetical protein